MIEPEIYCKVCGMAMECIARFYRENGRRPVVVEIGCADGQGTMRYAGFCERVICIDPMVEGRPDIDSRTKQDLVADKGKVELFRRRTAELRVELITGCSLWSETISELGSRLAGRKVDVLIIDGCHHPFEAVWGDFEAYYPFVSKGGYVVFDDIYEECILQAYEKAAEKMERVERWSSPDPNVRQEVAALRKLED